MRDISLSNYNKKPKEMAGNETLGNKVNGKCFAHMDRNSPTEKAVFPVQNRAFLLASYSFVSCILFKFYLLQLACPYLHF